MPYTIDLIRKIETLDENTKEIMFQLLSELEKNYAKKDDIGEIKETIKELTTSIKDMWSFLAESSKKHQIQIDQLTERIDKLAENTQQHSERIKEIDERLKILTERIDKLAETTQQHSERIKEIDERLDRLTERIDKLAEITQQHSEKIKEIDERLKILTERIDKLAEITQQHSEKIDKLIEITQQHSERIMEIDERLKILTERVDKLAETTQQHSERLDKLIKDHEETRSQLGGLSHTVGYFLEDKSYIYLPNLLYRDYGIEIEGELYRDYIQIGKNKYVEVNILGKGRKDGKDIYIIGEAKTQAKKKDIDEVVEMAQKVSKVIKEDKFLVLVTYQTSPQVREYARQKNVHIYFSFQLK